MICRNCNSQIQDGVPVCPYCGFNNAQQQTSMYNNDLGQGSVFSNGGQNVNQYNNYTQPPKKKNKGCLIAVIVALVVLFFMIGGLLLGGVVLYNVGKEAATIMETEWDDYDYEEFEEPDDLLIDETDDSDFQYDFKDSDGDGVLDGDIFDRDSDEFVIDEAYLGEFISETFRAASIVQVADGVHWQLIAKLNDISSTENLELILSEDTKSLSKLKALKNEYGLINCYDSEHLETIKELILKDIDNEIFLLEKYLKVSEEIRNGDQSGVEQFYKDEELFKQRDLNLEGFYNLLLGLGDAYGLDTEKTSEYMMRNVSDIEMPEFN